MNTSKHAKVKNAQKRKLVTITGFKEHLNNPTDKGINAADLRPIKEASILGNQVKRGMKELICLTMYNEPYKQIVESLAGIYRNYYELVAQDPFGDDEGEENPVKIGYENRVSVVIICDGFGSLDKLHTGASPNISCAQKLAKIGLFEESKMARYLKKTIEVKENEKKCN